jgi:hypothetical protein
MHLDKTANNLEIRVFKTSMQNFMCPFTVMMLICHSVNKFWMIHIKLFNMLCKHFLNPPQNSMMVFNISHSYVWMIFICVSFLPNFMSNRNSLQISWFVNIFISEEISWIFHVEFERKLYSWRITII